MGKQASRRASWLQHVAAWKVSGLTQRAYADKHGIGWRSLSYWIQKVRKHATRDSRAAPPATCPEQHSAFITLATDVTAILKKTRSHPGAFHLQIGPRYRLRIPANFSGDALAEVIRVLEDRR